MTLSEIRERAIAPALALLPARMNSPEAVTLMLAIGLQESRFIHRKQIGGPARGFFQFEQGGGVRGVLRHPASATMAAELCVARGVDPAERVIYEALAEDDVLAAGFARLLLWTDAKPLPKVGAAQSAWDYYIRNWRPGRPHPKTWDALYEQVMEEVTCSA